MTGSIKRLHTRTSLSKRYGVTTNAIKFWYNPAGVIPPRKKGGFFREKDIESLDYIYVANRYCKLTFREYECNVLPKGGLEEYIMDANKISLKDFLLDPEYTDQDDIVVQDILRRIASDDTYQSDGFRVKDAA